MTPTAEATAEVSVESMPRAPAGNVPAGSAGTLEIRDATFESVRGANPALLPEELTVHSSGEKPTEDEISGMEILVPLSALPGDEGYHISKDPRVKAVAWRDLVKVNRWQAFKETTLSFPWIAATLAFYWLAQSSGNLWWCGAALFCSFYLFLTGLRQVHCAYHYSIGISRRGCDLLMSFLSVAMTGSMHVVQLCHLHHHRTNMTPEDVEGFTGRLKWWQAILVGPYFPAKMHWFALKTAKPNQRRWIYAELALNVAFTAFVAVMVFAFNQWWLGLYLVTMWTAQCGTGFFAVWTVHHGCDDKHHIARTQRGWLKNFISYQMFHHIEHHLFPAVPTCHWAKLGKRLDEAAPELRTKGVY